MAKRIQDASAVAAGFQPASEPRLPARRKTIARHIHNMKSPKLTVFILGLGLLVGCATRTAREPVKSTFLTRYDQLQKVDDTTWRYVDAAHLRSYHMIKIQPVQVLAKSFNRKPVTESEQKMAADYVVMALVKALSDRYPIMSRPGPGVGEVRLALTSADMRGTQLGLTLEGEILDSSSHAQVAALRKSEISGRHDQNWSYRLTFRQMVNAWAADLRRAFDEVHSRETTNSP